MTRTLNTNFQSSGEIGTATKKFLGSRHPSRHTNWLVFCQLLCDSRTSHVAEIDAICQELSFNKKGTTLHTLHTLQIWLVFKNHKSSRNLKPAHSDFPAQRKRWECVWITGKQNTPKSLRSFGLFLTFPSTFFNGSRTTHKTTDQKRTKRKRCHFWS